MTVSRPVPQGELRRTKVTFPRCLLVLTIVLACLSLTTRAYSQATTGKNSNHQAEGRQESTIFPTDIPIEVNADRLSYNHATNTYIVRGNVALSQGNTRLRADSVSYNANTGELTAKGGVIVRIEGDVVEADEFTLRLRDATGVLFNGKLLLTRNNIYLEGRKLEKVGDSTYRINKGSFTTCDGVRPDWRITGEDLDVTLEGYGTLKHGFFYIKDIPVFYIPWLIYPAKRKRQSGFLMPTMANSSVRGFDVRFPFFININPSMDATIVPRICTKRAAQASLEFRYTPYENLRGRFYGEYTYDWKYGPETDPESHRFYLTLRHDQEIAGWMRFKANGSWVSDRDYFEFWGGPVRPAPAGSLSGVKCHPLQTDQQFSLSGRGQTLRQPGLAEQRADRAEPAHYYRNPFQQPDPIHPLLRELECGLRSLLLTGDG